MMNQMLISTAMILPRISQPLLLNSICDSERQEACLLHQRKKDMALSQKDLKKVNKESNAPMLMEMVQFLLPTMEFPKAKNKL
jgi:hypothetical protein